jgi:hypothetical protein
LYVQVDTAVTEFPLAVHDIVDVVSLYTLLGGKVILTSPLLGISLDVMNVKV